MFSVHLGAVGDISAVQKIQKLSESPTTTDMVAKLCGINCKNRKITDPDSGKNFSSCFILGIVL